jgi:hypothetical protein
MLRALPNVPNSVGKPIIHPRGCCKLKKNMCVGKKFPPTPMNHQRKEKQINNRLPRIRSKRFRVPVNRALQIAKKLRMIVIIYMERKIPKKNMKMSIHTPAARDR